MKKKSTSFSLAFLVFAVGSISATDVRSVADAVDQHYNHLHTLECQFTEIYSGAGTERTEAGTLWLKKPGKMRWEYRSPRAKLFVGDGKEAWFYVPGERQVRRTEMRKLDDLRSPLAFLLGKTRLEKELRGLSLAPDIPPLGPGDVVLRGVPKALADRVNQVLLEVTQNSWIRRIVIEEADGSTTEYRFADPREDVKIADGEFDFRVPDGVEVIDENFGQ
ncbi:MAG: outer membrane lipoprotein chaperone LolA [Acidobacteriaceae bacterium]|nr:outer membrane lipoprotein chaperone LolA [Acidobacteriaceae bacterium]